MSSSQDLSAIIQEQIYRNIYNYALVASLVLLSYDTLLTLPKEIELLWKGKLGIAALLYSLARYPQLLYFSVAMIPDGVLSMQACSGIIVFLDTLTLAARCGIDGLLLARTYAISKNNRVVLFVLGSMMLGPIILEIIIISKDSCSPSISVLKIAKLANIIGNILNLLFETAVIAVTLIHTLGILQLQKGLKMMQRKSLVSLLTEQGILRYGFVLTFNLTLTVYTQIGESNDIRAALGSIQRLLSVIIICRFFLDLRHRNLHPNTTLPSLPIPIGSFHVATMTHRVHNAILEEFGDPINNGEESIHEGIES